MRLITIILLALSIGCTTTPCKKQFIAGVVLGATAGAIGGAYYTGKKAEK